jgi:hypothetical protein
MVGSRTISSERVEQQLNPPAEQGGVDLIGVVVHGHGGGLGDGAVLHHRNASRSCAGDGRADGAPVLKCCIGVRPFSEWVRRWAG